MQYYIVTVYLYPTIKTNYQKKVFLATPHFFFFFFYHMSTSWLSFFDPIVLHLFFPFCHFSSHFFSHIIFFRCQIIKSSQFFFFINVILLQFISLGKLTLIHHIYEEILGINFYFMFRKSLKFLKVILLLLILWVN